MVEGKLISALITAGTNALPTIRSEPTANKNSPTKLNAIPHTAPKIAYCNLIDTFLIKKHVTARLIPSTNEKI